MGNPMAETSSGAKETLLFFTARMERVKAETLTPVERELRSAIHQWTGQMIALGKFFRDHAIEKLLETSMRRAAKEASEEKFYRLNRRLVDCLAAAAPMSPPPNLATPPTPPQQARSDVI